MFSNGTISFPDRHAMIGAVAATGGRIPEPTEVLTLTDLGIPAKATTVTLRLTICPADASVIVKATYMPETVFSGPSDQHEVAVPGALFFQSRGARSCTVEIIVADVMAHS